MKRVSNEYSFIFHTCKASPLILRQYEISNVFNWLQFFATDEAKSPYNWEQRDKFNFYSMNWIIKQDTRNDTSACKPTKGDNEEINGASVIK